MSKIRHKYLLAVAAFMLVFVNGIHAQENFQINKVFETYGKKKGSTMVVFSGKTLDNYKLKKYRSITLAYDSAASQLIQESLEADREGAHKIKEVINSGIITSGYYQILSDNKKGYRYILFKVGNDGTATLIFMEGDIDSEELINRLFLK